jgi:cobalt-zinc-cadmium efflux system outer membrane protein
MGSRRFLWVLGLLLVYGCHSLPDTTDLDVNALLREVRDPEPLRSPDYSAPVPSTLPEKATPGMPEPGPKPDGAGRGDDGPLLAQFAGAVMQKDAAQPPPPKHKALTIPDEIPGVKTAPPIVWPKDKEEQKRVVKELYPPLSPLPVEAPPQPGPGGRALTLSDLQGLAVANHPSIRNAVAAIEAAKGAVKQAGAYPNPTVGWEADTIGTSGAVNAGTGGGGSGYQGGWVDQIIKGANGLKLATAAALMDLRNAELALKKARSDLATQVRSSYFAVLVALENIKVSRALAKFTNEVYRRQVDLLGAGVAAPYEPMQLRPLALQARFNLYQAEQQYRASWRQLAANLGLPNMPPTELAGRVDMAVPVFEHEAVRDYVLNRHTDVLTGLNGIQKARYLLELARVTPFPDFDVRMVVQKDYTAPPFVVAWSGVVSVKLPVWDLNRGNVQQAQGLLTQAFTAPQQTRLTLTGTLADAYNRYLTAKEQVRIVLQQVQDQVRAYRGVYDRYRFLRPDDPAVVTFGDVVTAQQTLVTYVSTYITALGLQWTAVVDVANLLQTNDLFQTGRTEEVAPVPDLEHLLTWPWVNATGACAANHPAPAAAQGGDAGTARPATLLPPCSPGQTPAPAAGSAVRPGPGLSFAETAPVIQSAPASPPDRPVATPAGLAGR